MHGNIMTDLGEEKRCARCGEYWPADEEFFAACRNNKSGLHSYCRACCTERKFELRHGAERKVKSYERKRVENMKVRVEVGE